MPHFTLLLSQGAPIIDLMVSASSARSDALIDAGLFLPSPQRIRGLIDTGASNTCIGPTVFDALKLRRTGSVPVITPSTGNVPIDADTYDVNLSILNAGALSLKFENMEVTASDLLFAQGFHALVGRDILSQCILIYNGSNDMFTLSY